MAPELAMVFQGTFRESIADTFAVFSMPDTSIHLAGIPYVDFIRSEVVTLPG